MLILRTLFLIFSMALIAMPAHAVPWWDDEMEAGSFTGAPNMFDPLPIINPQGQEVVTSPKFSGAGSLQYNYYDLCHESGPGQPCGGWTDRYFPNDSAAAETNEHYGRLYLRVSQNFKWSNANGQSKLWGVRSSTGDNKLWFNFYFGLGMIVSAENTPNTGSTTNIPINITMPREEWHCIEWHFIKNNPAGTPNGTLQTWFDGTQTLLRTNVQWSGSTNTSVGWNHIRIYRQAGGPLVTGIGEVAHVWFDRVATGSTRIGCAGSPPPPDTTPPSPPTAPTLSSSGGSVTFNWVNGSDAVAVASAAIERCTGLDCTATAPLTTVSASNGTAGTINDTTVAPGTVYGYKVRNIDTSSNPSTFTSIIYITTPTTFRTTLATDNFNRANNTDLGANWDAGYTGNDPLAIQSNQVRVATLNADSLDTYNAVTTPNDQWSQFTLSLASGSGTRAPRALVRFSDAPNINGYECGALLPSTYRCGEWNAGVFTQKTTATWTWAAGDKIRTEAEGTTIRGYVIRGATETLVSSFTDPTHASGKTGIIHYIATGSTSDVQIDDFFMGVFQSEATANPSVTSLILDPNGADVQFGGSTPPTNVRLTFGTNSGSFTNTIIIPYAEFVNGRYDITWLSGMQYACFVAINNLGQENNTAQQYQCGNLILAGVPPIDQTPAMLTNPFPTSILPAGTTQATIGFTMNKTSPCRFNLTDVDYSLMSIQADGSNLTASTTITGLTNGYSTPYYYRCNFTNDHEEEYPNTSSGTILLQVDTVTADTTLPDDVTNVVANPVPNSSDVSVVFDETGDDVAISRYDIYKSTGPCLAYVFSGSVTSSPAVQTNNVPNTFTCFKMKGVDTSNNESLNFSNVATVTTGESPDVVPPLQLRFKSIVPGTVSADVEWESGVDDRGLTTSQLEYCAGSLCSNFTFASPVLSSLETVIDLLPDTFYRLRGRHFDPSGNHGPYSEIQEFRTLALPTSEAPAPGVCNCRNQHDARH